MLIDFSTLMLLFVSVKSCWIWQPKVTIYSNEWLNLTTLPNFESYSFNSTQDQFEFNTRPARTSHLRAIKVQYSLEHTHSTWNTFAQKWATGNFQYISVFQIGIGHLPIKIENGRFWVKSRAKLQTAAWMADGFHCILAKVEFGPYFNALIIILGLGTWHTDSMPRN